MNLIAKILFTACLLVGFSFRGGGQNLVVNPSFEDTVSCPVGVGDFSVVDWYSPTTGTPDLFHPCNTNNVGVPQNSFGYQNARTGNAYTGIYNSDFSTNEYREYIQCQLISVLEAGKFYEVIFYVSRTDSSTKACDNIGAYLSSTAISSSNNQNLPYTPQVVSPPNNPITDAIGWTQIIDTITAIGGEQYLTIGIFTNNANTNWIPVSGGWESEAHYYIDDVSVIEVSSNSINEINQPHISVFPNPSNGFIYVNSNEIIKNYTVHSSLGQLIINNFPNTTNFHIDLTNHSTGIYYINIQTTTSNITKKIIIN